MSGPARWPLETLDVGGLRRAGRAAVPFRQFVLKMHSRCNLACAYCYVYEGADESWRERPSRVGRDVMAKAAVRIAEHAARHRLPVVHVNLHGGEPLLAGAAPLIAYVNAVREALDARCEHPCEVRPTVQTNGTLLTERTVTDLAAEGIGIGISLDGGTASLNARRVGRQGRSAWPAMLRGVRLLSRHPGTYLGILCTIDLESDPLAVYRSLAGLSPPSLDFLLPHANWSAPPAGNGSATPYADWLIRVFDAWFDAGRPVTRVRLFTEIVGLLLGVASAIEAVGTSPVTAVVVDTDGAIEQVDSLKSAYEGAPATGLDVFRNSFDEALEHPGVVARQLGADALAAQCVDCPVVSVCGGGNYAHRYRKGAGFRNPSVYCADLERLIRHIARRLDNGVRPNPLD
ncbi:FxsB family cyclophane-forming radical SAM/SPASM peptide maturase [Streptomyces sp. cg35]|uniref:FxsB family cyclophane-forming radical SAM/SPASM peptide maturase n=1 Tax=Streptomyces sp. cg35 TaxID=3421650 RepID=UPI003D187095